MQVQLLEVEQLSDLLSLAQYVGQQTLSVKDHEPHAPFDGDGYAAWVCTLVVTAVGREVV